VALVRDYQAVQAYHDAAALASGLIAEDDARRYIIEKDAQVKTSDGTTVCALVTRQHASVKPGPALLLFTIYMDLTDNLNDARLTAANGYVGVVGFTCGKACSPDAPIPYEHDGTDASALIAWITSEPWSDGGVGMYEGSYNVQDGSDPIKNFSPRAVESFAKSTPATHSFRSWGYRRKDDLHCYLNRGFPSCKSKTMVPVRQTRTSRSHHSDLCPC
jgi:hypothetical protein